MSQYCWMKKFASPPPDYPARICQGYLLYSFAIDQVWAVWPPPNAVIDGHGKFLPPLGTLRVLGS